MGEKTTVLEGQLALLAKQTAARLDSLEERLAEMINEGKRARADSEAQIEELRAVCAAQTQTIVGQQTALGQAREQTEALVANAVGPLLARLAAVERAQAEESLVAGHDAEEAQREAEAVRARAEQERSAHEARTQAWLKQMEAQV